MKLQNKMLVAVAFAISTVGSFAQELEVNLQIRPRFEYRNGFKELMKDDFYPTSFVSQRSRMNSSTNKRNSKSIYRFKHVRV